MSKRLDVIYNSKTKLEATKRILALQDRAISFSGRQEIADQLGDESFHSKADKTALERFKDGKISKLSVVSMVSMGVTIPDLKVADPNIYGFSIYAQLAVQDFYLSETDFGNNGFCFLAAFIGYFKQQLV